MIVKDITESQLAITHAKSVFGSHTSPKLATPHIAKLETITDNSITISVYLLHVVCVSIWVTVPKIWGYHCPNG